MTSELQNFIQQRYEDTALVIYREQHSGSLSRLRFLSNTGTEIGKQHSAQCWQDEQHAERQNRSKANQIVPGAELMDGRDRDKKISHVKRVVQNENDRGQKSVHDGAVASTTQSRICVIM